MTFVGELRAVPFNFAPTGWALCNGQILPIAQNTALFALLGTTYGGDGKSTFALPNLQGRVALAPGQGPGLSLYDLGQMAGEENVTLLQSEIPMHTHQLSAADAAGTVNAPTGALLAEGRGGHGPVRGYAASNAATSALDLGTAFTGGNQPHNNLPPYLVLNYIIALQGVYPPRT